MRYKEWSKNTGLKTDATKWMQIKSQDRKDVQSIWANETFKVNNFISKAIFEVEVDEKLKELNFPNFAFR